MIQNLASQGKTARPSRWISYLVRP